AWRLLKGKRRAHFILGGQMTSRFGLVVAIPVIVIGGAVSAGGCGGVVNVASGGAGGNPSSTHSTTNATTAAPSTTSSTMTGACESACTVMSSCKGGVYATCLQSCQSG